MRVLNTGNVKIAGSATRATTEGTNHLDIFDGTAPVGTLAAGISLYSTSGELRVMDSGGTATLLSPHPDVFLGTLPVVDRPSPWAYVSENTYLGTRVLVDLAGAIAELERLSGKRFITIESLPAPRGNWDADQETLRVEREAEIARAPAERRLAPPPYVKKGPPKWLRDRGVTSALP